MHRYLKTRIFLRLNFLSLKVYGAVRSNLRTACLVHQYKLFGKQGVGSLFAALEERAALTLKIERVILLVCQTSTKSPPAMFASLAKRRHWQPASAIRGRSIGFCPLHYPQACFSRPAFLRQALCQSLASWDFVYLVWTDLGSLDQPVARAVVGNQYSLPLARCASSADPPESWQYEGVTAQCFPARI